MKKKRLIRRRCGDGCGGITNYGKKYINGHNKPMLNKQHTEESKQRMRKPKSDETKKKISLGLKGHKQSKKTILKRSIAMMGNTYGKALKGRKQTKEHIKNRSIAKTKYDPNYEYCDIWKDREYKKDIRKDYCENKNCKEISKRLGNHHIYLDKKRCAPEDIITMCYSCHVALHNKLRKYNPKDFIIISRPDHVSYIHKPTRKIIRIERV